MTPLEAARAALAPASPEWRVVLAAEILAEALRNARAAGVLGMLIDTGALEIALADARATIETADPRPAVKPGDHVVFHAPQRVGVGPQRTGVVRAIRPDGVEVATSWRSRVTIPHGAVVRNLTLAPDGGAA